MTDGQQVRLEGIYDRKCEKYFTRLAICLADPRIFDLQHNPLVFDKDHTWVQEAWQLKKLKMNRGDKLSFIATVRRYRNKKGRLGIGFTDPKAIEWEPFTI